MPSLTLPYSVSFRGTLSFVVLTLLISILLDANDWTLRSSGAPPREYGADVVVGRAQSQPDMTSLLQGVPRVDLLSLGDSDKATKAVDHLRVNMDMMSPVASQAKASIQAKPARNKDGPQSSMAHTSTKAAGKSSDVALLNTLVGGGIAGDAKPVQRLDGLLGVSSRLGSSTILTSATAGIAILLLVVLIGCTCLAALSIVVPLPFGSGARRNATENPPGPKNSATVLEQRDRMLVNSHTGSSSGLRAPQPPSSRLASPMQDGLAPQTGSPTFNPMTHSFTHSPVMPTSRPDLGIGQTPRESLPPDSEPSERISTVSKPPPLCPSLVMPSNEARLGIPMFELAQVNTEGRLNIVGITGKPLLRASVHNSGAARRLEISMPEQNTVPRATIAPAALSSEGERERAMEIRGVRGAFYGILEMRSSGACYVVKEGQTVLTIDGDAESLQLAIKSSVGLQLASVRCSAELFEGVDHVEIRVEPGVDTVLVIGVVLAVLLLSPYLPPADGQ